MSEAAQSTERKTPPTPIPLTVLTGFLGAGKTTLLNRLLKDPALSDSAVIINEFGEVGLDHLLVEYVSDNMVLLQSGCLCCTMRGDLVDVLETLLRDLDNRRCSFRRVLLETTGLADPAPVLHTVMSHPYLLLRYRLDGVVTVVDAINGEATLDAHVEAVKQAAVADRLVLTKSDLVDPVQCERIAARLRALNPAAPILDAAKGEAMPDGLLGSGLYDPDKKIPDVRKWLAAEAHSHSDHHHHHDVNRHDEHIRSFVLTAEDAVPAGTLEMFLELLRATHGAKLLRLKGIVKLAEMPDTPVVVHGVQHVFHPTARLDCWPDDDHRTRLVFITRDLPERVVTSFSRPFSASPPQTDPIARRSSTIRLSPSAVDSSASPSPADLHAEPVKLILTGNRTLAPE